MISFIWLAGLSRRRTGRLAAASLGVALAVALIGSIATFLSGALATMTSAAIAQVSVDYQVQANAGQDPAGMLDAARSEPGVRAALPVEFVDSPGLQATTGATVQQTGAAVVVGVPREYEATFPGEVRTLIGNPTGVVLAQQTAANLHVIQGDTITIARAGMTAIPVRVDGVVDLPQADSLFQKVGAPPGAQPSAPPDNVVVVPLDTWHRYFDGLSTSRPDLVRHQVHIRLDHHLPSDPASAFNHVIASAHHLELALAGGVSVGNNLGAALDAARSDAVYAQILFVLLGAPGIVLAGLFTVMASSAAADRRRRDFALLRLRGATSATMVRTAAIEAAAVAIIGSALGLGAAALVGQGTFGSATFGTSTRSAALWAGASVLIGVTVALAALVIPAWRDARRMTVVAARRAVSRTGSAWWRRIGLDFWLLAGAGLVFWLTSRSGYQVVLVPEGLPTLSVNYAALSGPLLFWAGAGLLSWRLAESFFGRGRRLVARLARPLAGVLSGIVASGLSRHRSRLAAPVALVGLTLAFAASTAVFNTTYRHQAGVDARLTNGADVTVAYPASSPASPGDLSHIASVSGVRHVEPLLHRFAYVGADLQDLYGVRTSTIVSAARLQDVQFGQGNASTLVSRLAHQADGVLVSAETVRDFQLKLGDPLHLRLRGRSGQLSDVTFHFAGVVAEFPTAPRDSFLVANADYLASSTGDPGVDVFLVDTGGRHVAAIAQRLRTVLGPTANVTDLATTRHQVGSSLTAVNLSGLTRVELGFALALAAGAAGLVLAETLAERRRSYAIVRALGARPRQVTAFIRVESTLVTGLGLALGALIGWGLAQLLVKILKGLFDPPPTHLFAPWSYLILVGSLTVAAAAVATVVISRAARRPVVETIRDL